MYRKHFLHGCCIACFGAGLLLGHYIDSWLLCCMGGMVLAILGLCAMGKS